MTETNRLPPAYLGDHQPKPLTFDPAKLRGLSEKLLRSHHENNYTGAVKRLNLIQQQLGQLAKDAPPYQTGSLKREELIATNSMLLHELYFGNLGGDGKPSGTIVEMLKAHYGSMETWDQEFRQTGLSLGGGSGWVVPAFDPRERAPHTNWLADHTRLGHPPSGHGHVRAFVRDGLRGERARLHRRVLPECPVGRGESSCRAGEGGVSNAPTP